MGKIGLDDSGRPYRVMVVDDSLFVQRQLSKLLNSEGFSIVDTAMHGREAVEKYQALHPEVDLVTMDVTMPGMDGITALSAIREFDEKAVVIVVTALGKTELLKEALLKGAAGYILKPLHKDEVRKKMGAILKRI